MNITINRIEQIGEIPYDLLLLADENPALIDTYLLQSQPYVLLIDGQVPAAISQHTFKNLSEVVL